MKKIGSVLVWASVAVTLFGAVMMDDAATRWINILNWVPDSLHPVIGGIMDAATNVVLLVSLMVATIWALGLAARVVAILSGLAPFAFFRFKKVLGMSQYLSERNALERIRQSTFFRIRQKIDDGPGSHIGSAMRSALGMSLPLREQVIRDRFSKKMLREFSAIDGAFVEGKGYRAMRLDQWLEALLDAEVDDEMGHLPHAYLPPFQDDGEDGNDNEAS